MAKRNIVQRRPAESVGVLGSFAMIIAHLCGVDSASQLTGIGAAVGLLPAVVTQVVEVLRGLKSS